jgi:hypothetical protein
VLPRVTQEQVNVLVGYRVLLEQDRPYRSSVPEAVRAMRSKMMAWSLMSAYSSAKRVGWWSPLADERTGNYQRYGCSRFAGL